ncbi:hypothetical protein [Streptomyces sp. NPDC058701]|uniref:hypothetical protein n=1 Tax=Streptomyces sp. NPDC058701 TaxID=3346608 RepID=UPI003648A1A5
MSDDQFRAWRWDREDMAANRQALVLFRHGHEIRCDHKGLLLDGRRLDTTPIYTPVPAKDGAPAPAPLELGDDGRLVYRGRLLARLTPPAPGTAGPGPLEVLVTTSTVPPVRRAA